MKTHKQQTFENYLDDIYAKQYCSSDDLLPDDRAEWYEQLDVQEVIDYAEDYVEKRLKEFAEGIIKNIENKKWTYIEGDIAISEGAKMQIIEINNKGLNNIQANINNYFK